MKDHEKRELVNALTKIAQEYGHTQQLRERIAHCVLPALTSIKPDSVKVKHWGAYGLEGTLLTHQFDIADARMESGQASMTLGALEGDIDDMLDVLVEVNTHPVNGIDQVPCAHVAFDADNMAFSIFKIGNQFLLRPEVGVVIDIMEIHHTSGGPVEIMYRIEAGEN